MITVRGNWPICYSCIRDIAIPPHQDNGFAASSVLYSLVQILVEWCRVSGISGAEVLE